MKFLRFICNVFLFFGVLIGISLVQIGVYDICAAQSDDVDGIHILAPNEEDVAYFDSYAFWAEDIGTGFKQPAKYRIRNWASAGWWKKGMAWADYGLDFLIAAVKPVVVPVAQTNAVKNYYGYTINHFDEYSLKYVYESEEAYNNALYEVYVIFDMGYGDAMTCGETPVPIENWNYTGSYEGDGNEVDYARWVNKNKKLYNNIWKLEKYNSGSYDKYYTKFVDEEDGVRHIKTATIVLYYQQYVSIVIALIFVIKYPISLGQHRTEGIRDNKNIR